MSRIIQIFNTKKYIDLDNICTLEIQEFDTYDCLIINGVRVSVPDKRDTKNILEQWFNPNLIIAKENK